MSMEYYDPELVLETEYLMLRALRRDDALAIYHAINHDREVLKYYVAPYIEDEKDASVDGTVRYAETAGVYIFAIVLKETGEVIGMINQCNKMNPYFRNVEVGYAIARKYWNRGYCTEALVAMIDLLLSRGVHKVFCQHVLENEASEKVMIKTGMKKEGMRRDELYYRDRYWDVNCYYVLNDRESGNEV